MREILRYLQPASDILQVSDEDARKARVHSSLLIIPTSQCASLSHFPIFIPFPQPQLPRDVDEFLVRLPWKRLHHCARGECTCSWVGVGVWVGGGGVGGGWGGGGLSLIDSSRRWPSPTLCVLLTCGNTHTHTHTHTHTQVANNTVYLITSNDCPGLTMWMHKKHGAVKAKTGRTVTIKVRIAASIKHGSLYATDEFTVGADTLPAGVDVVKVRAFPENKRDKSGKHGSNATQALVLDKSGKAALMFKLAVPLCFPNSTFTVQPFIRSSASGCIEQVSVPVEVKRSGKAVKTC